MLSNYTVELPQLHTEYRLSNYTVHTRFNVGHSIQLTGQKQLQCEVHWLL